MISNTDPSNTGLQSLLAVWAILSVYLLILCILISRDSLRLAKQLSRDLEDGTVKQFEGPAREMIVTNDLLKQISRLGLAPDDQGRFRLEILPVSGRVWKVQGESLGKWVQLHRSEVAPPPPFAQLAAQFLEPVHEAEDRTLSRGQREMTSEEAAELLKHARQVWKSRLFWAVLLNFWFVSSLVSTATSNEGYGTEAYIIFSLFAAAVLWYDASFFRRVWTTFKLRQDAREGRVIILGSNDTDGIKDQEVFEVLPNSKWIWTVDGAPAPWRKIS
jgi:hypothetical protein